MYAYYLINILFKDEKLILMTFNDCQVSDETGKIYFEPSWGNFDMTIGDSIISVFNGAADKNIFEDQLYVSSQRTFHQNYTSKDINKTSKKGYYHSSSQVYSNEIYEINRKIISGEAPIENMINQLEYLKRKKAAPQKSLEKTFLDTEFLYNEKVITFTVFSFRLWQFIG